MAVTTYFSTDSGAPTLTGEVNALINLLTQCLVNGYGSKPGVGWSKPFSGTNKAVFKAGGGTQACLWVDDNAPGAAGARECRLRGYEVMSALDTGTGAFPTTTQMAVPIIYRKSTSLDASSRPWILIADDRRFYLFSYPGEGTANRYTNFFFGDIISYKTGGDLYSAAIIGRATENSAAESYDALSQVGTAVNASAATGHYMARSHTGIGSALQFSKFHDSSLASASYVGSGQYMAYPNPVDGGLYMSPVRICYSSILRGHLPGFWAPMHTRPLVHGDTFAGVGNMSGKTFLVIDLWNSAQVFMETSNTWS